MSFSKRLLKLKTTSSHKAFAETLGISEALLRKYLNGSDPSLSKATQIAEKAKVSLGWLATGKEPPYSSKPSIDIAVFEQAIQLVNDVNLNKELHLTSNQVIRLSVTSYEYIQSIKEINEGTLEVETVKNFIYHLAKMYCM
jgi:transcriptional regulator with XRE-family HTH domain